MNYPGGKGFTLVEMAIVVLIIGLIAAIAIPMFMESRKQSRSMATANNLRLFRDAVEFYHMDTGDYPPSGGVGVLPSILEPYINKGRFEDMPAIGGGWEVCNNENGYLCTIGVTNSAAHQEDLEKVDEILDDGNLTTGNLQLITSNRLHWIVAE